MSRGNRGMSNKVPRKSNFLRSFAGIADDHTWPDPRPVVNKLLFALWNSPWLLFSCSYGCRNTWTNAGSRGMLFWKDTLLSFSLSLSLSLFFFLINVNSVVTQHPKNWSSSPKAQLWTLHFSQFTLTPPPTLLFECWWELWWWRGCGRGWWG